MKRLSLSLRILFGLVILYAVLASVSVFLPQMGNLPGGGVFPASKPVVALANAAIVLVLYGGLGYAGYLLCRSIGFPGIWDPKVTIRQRFMIPLLLGSGIGIFFILGDLIFSSFNTIGRLQHPPFPMSLLASITAGIGEEIIFRLFFISFWVWLVAFKILKGKGQNIVFWIISLFSALAFGFGHLPAVMLLYGWEIFGEIPPVLIAEIILLNAVLSLFAAYYFRRYGILAAIGIHFWADIVWHLLWGLI